MSLDKSLNLSAAKKPQIVDQKDARRSRLLKRIENQIAIDLPPSSDPVVMLV